MTTFSRLPPQFLLPSSSPVPPQFLVLVPPPGSSPFPLPRSLLLRLPLKSFPLQTSLPSTFRHLSFHPPWFLGQDAKRQRIGVSFPHKFEDLSKNKFSEDFPTFLTRMKQVQHITPHITASPLLPYPNPHLRRRLSHNNFTGSIPASISSLASLTYLDLRIPTLTGSIPASMGAMLNLQYLYVNYDATPCGNGESDCEVQQYFGTAFCRACFDFCLQCYQWSSGGNGDYDDYYGKEEKEGMF
ncbi:unnamed protein product [Closterium sp. NIES-65]|nr:unnamed protein product [Closterium sp. NIES-65]